MGGSNASEQVEYERGEKAKPTLDENSHSCQHEEACHAAVFPRL